jgi:hypothetical protein
MTEATVPVIDQPNCYRPGRNSGASDIARGHLLKAGASYQSIVLATSTSDKPAGVAAEVMEGTTVGAITRDRMISGQAMVICGAAVAIGDDITTDSSGRGIATTGAAQAVWGRAQTATSAAGEQFAMEINLGGKAATPGGVQMLEMTLDYTDLVDAETNQDFSLGTLPADTWLVGYQVVPDDLIVKATATFALDIGYTGAAEFCAASLNVGYGGTADTPLQAAISKALTADTEILANVAISTGNLGDGTDTLCTAGSTIIRLFYMTANPVTVVP